MTKTIDKDYDDKLKANLTSRLNRNPKSNELVNADTDSDLVTETLWQIIVELDNRIKKLEGNIKI